MEQQKGLTGSTLKIIAMVTMLIDHIGASILERGVMPKVADGSVMDAGVEAMKVYNRWKVVDMACRGIGRIAFPIFCFLLVEGFLHTGNWKKYFSRLFLFSLISEVPFDLAVFKSWYDFSSQNVFFTLWIALLVLAGMKYVSEKQEWSEALQLFGTDCRSNRWNGSGTSVTYRLRSLWSACNRSIVFFCEKTESNKYFAAVCCFCGRLRHRWHFYRSTTIMASGA